MSLQKKILLFLAFLALLGTVTNYVYLSPILTLFFPLILFVLNKEKVERPIAWLYAYLVIFLISAVLYDWHSLFEFGFYRRDGNFIISYAPLLLLPLFTMRFKLKNYLRYFYLFTMVLYCGAFAVHLLTLDDLNSLHDVVFGGLFQAQNAVGGFLSIVAGLGFAYYYHKRTGKELFLFLLLFLFLVATYSRGSIVGLLLGITGWYLAVHKRFKMLVALLTIPVLFTVGALMIGYPYYEGKITADNMAEEQVGDDVSLKAGNVLIRILYTFPRAYYSFRHSPVMGIGVGGYDDRPYDFQEIIPGLQYNAQRKKAHTDSHAHHSYLHILAEQGIFGLTVFLVFWVSLFWYLLHVRKQPVIRDFLLIAYFTITFASFTEHRITTPSMILPFTISLGMFMAHKEKFKTVKIVKR